MSKLYYSSSEVSTMLELEPSVLRFWEDQFSQLRIKRNRAGKRMYREKDIELMRTIKELTRDEGYTIAGARKRLQESAADRSASAKKADPGAAKPDHDVKHAGRGVDQADSGAATAATAEHGDSGAATAATAEHGDSGAATAAAAEHGDSGAATAATAEASDRGVGHATAPEPATEKADEIIQWVRSNLVDLRRSMD